MIGQFEWQQNAIVGRPDQFVLRLFREDISPNIKLFQEFELDSLYGIICYSGSISAVPGMRAKFQMVIAKSERLVHVYKYTY